VHQQVWESCKCATSIVSGGNSCVYVPTHHAVCQGLQASRAFAKASIQVPPSLRCLNDLDLSALFPPLLRVLSHQRVLSSYAGELLKRLPKTMTGGTAAQPPYSGTDWHVRLPDEEESVLCSILATAEYCR
jgi:hypothetical protein